MKCEKCNDLGYYYVHGVLETRIKFECECNQKKDDVHMGVTIVGGKVIELK